MLVMPANNRGLVVGWLAGRFPGRIGHLYSPGGMARTYDWLPYALDNGRFSCRAAGATWDPDAYLGLLERATSDENKPTWILVPDSVGDRDHTLRDWDAWAPRLQSYGLPLAIAVQDGMEPDDIPREAEVIFVGGGTEWKRRTMHDWCSSFARVHIGRINTERWLWECDRAGAESCDGTGWIRGDQAQLNGLIRYLERSCGGLGDPQGEPMFRPIPETARLDREAHR